MQLKEAREQTVGYAVLPLRGGYASASPTEAEIDGGIKRWRGVVVEGVSSVEPPVVK